MRRTALRASLLLWQRRLKHRQRKVDVHRGRAKSGEGDATAGVVTAREAALIDKWERLRDHAKHMVARRRRQLAPPVASAREQAVRAFAAHIGTTERPPGSNGNPANVSRWQAEFGFGRVPWCGIACAHFLRRAGVRGVSSRLASVALIEQDAKAHHGCFRGWTATRHGVLRGDLVVIGGHGVHVEMVEKLLDGGRVQTIGGNTSPGRAGSQANGGGVWRRVRAQGETRGFALVDY